MKALLLTWERRLMENYVVYKYITEYYFVKVKLIIYWWQNLKKMVLSQSMKGLKSHEKEFSGVGLSWWHSG